MSIKYTVIERGEPGVTGGGTKKWYAQVKTEGEMSIDDLVKEIEKFSALSEADIRGVIIALENVIQKELATAKSSGSTNWGASIPVSAVAVPKVKKNLT